MSKASNKEVWGCFCAIVLVSLYATGIMTAMKTTGLLDWSWAAVLSPGWMLLIFAAASWISGALHEWGEKRL